jgi:hypothetical protein
LIEPLCELFPELFAPSENLRAVSKNTLLPIDEVGNLPGVYLLRTKRRRGSEYSRKERLQLH